MSQKEENSDYLNNLKNKIGNHSSFEVPKGYFDSLSNKVGSLIEKEALEGISEVNSKAGFEVPKGYFDTLQEKVNTKKSEGKVIRLFSLKSLSYAATILAIIGVSVFFLTQNQETSINPEIETRLLAANLSNEIEAFENIGVTEFFDNISTVDLALDDEIDFEEEVNIEEVIEEDNVVKEIIEEEITTEDIDIDIIDFSEDFELF